MSKLSDKIRIVSSDGEVLEEAGKKVGKEMGSPDITEKESIVDKVKGLLGKKKEEEPVEVDFSDVIGRPEVEETVSVVDRVKNAISKDKNDGYGDEPVDLSKAGRGSLHKPGKESSKKRTSDTGGQSPGSYHGGLEDVSEEKKKTGTPMLLGIILALAVVGIAVFIYLFNSSAMAAIDVVPQQVDDIEIVQALEGDIDNLETLEEAEQEEIDEVEEDLVEPAVEEEPVAEGDSEIKVDTPQEKEELINRIEQLEGTVETLEGEKRELLDSLNKALGRSQPEVVEDGSEGDGQ